ncbi:glycosyltransferase family 2 protein [Zunongwangia sp. HRR-M8]|uniref:glycosyltransferase family 2 protein n=1 Tax=Zunongwangia sp. HRR-M8 TaxID=3015170 RepID=UPI0022DDD956|nr:glycosyltransferase family 2 protein [Zunongwangia sp. HRR-M8]WBL23185.1 glycosyltransferase family 2 protein [Zunongwangia sp. HRR-M8]
MVDSKLVSIIIPTYNRAHFIGETLESVIEQTYQNWECIVVNDGSNDYTDELMEFYRVKDSRIQYHHRPDNKPKGANACRNYGFELSKGEYINWFDSDDLMIPQFIEKKISPLHISSFQFSICGCRVINDKKRNPYNSIRNKNFSLFKEIILFRNIIVTNSILFRRSYFEEKKLFDETIARGQETEFFCRLFYKEKKENYIIIDEPLFDYRIHPNSITGKNSINYVPHYRASQFKIAKQNFKRSIEIKDNYLIALNTSLIFKYYKDSLLNKDKSLSLEGYQWIKSQLFLCNKLYFFEFVTLGRILMLLNLSSYTFEKKWRDVLKKSYRELI